MFTLPSLPYADNALDPVISANTISFHHGKHHKTYVDNLNNLVKGNEFEGKSLEAIVQASAGKADKAAVFNNAAQVWNHTFYWNSLKHGGGGKPGAKLASMIDAAFGSFDEFRKQLSATSVSPERSSARMSSTVSTGNALLSSSNVGPAPAPSR